jgi:alkanesulfonate monooxygenase SsuD/methylene tetrahydromethanopterin reductase-like flavin-dependent oxidoreductase (luciferase family)
MELGLFIMPSHPPERPLRQGHEFDLQALRWADEFGYAEAWVGEHHSCPWEPNPAPDLLVAQALRETCRMRIGTGGFLLPYHHPAELANRAAFLDHISGGRYLFGIASGGLPSDWSMFNVDGMKGEHRLMLEESLNIIMGLWGDDEAFEYKGKYWTVRKPTPNEEGTLRAHLKPLQMPHPPISLSGLSVKSDTLKLCGERGFIPMSLNLNTGYVRGHWDTVVAGADAGGRVADRGMWRVSREICVAETEAAAWKLAVHGGLGRLWNEHLLPLFRNFKFLDYLKHAPDVADSDVTVEYLARHNWLVGTPEQVADKAASMFDDLGGFGHLVMLGTDYVEQPEAWRECMRLAAQEVMPKIRHLQPTVVSEPPRLRATG